MAEQTGDFLSPQRFERAIPFRESKGPFGPFKATRIWKDLIEHVKSRVEIKRRRHKMRHIDNCFTGTDTVDVVLHFLLNEKETFSADLSREKAVKVCQMLMHKKVIQSAVDKPGSGKPPVFEDSSSRLYQFVGEHAFSASAAESESETCSAGTGDQQNKKRHSNRLAEHCLEPEEEPDEEDESEATSTPLQELHANANPTSDSLPCSSGASRTLFQSNLGLGDVDRKLGKIGRALSAEGEQNWLPELWGKASQVEEAWREVALTQLLTLVELTFLDSILSEDKRTKQQQQRDHLIISNIMARNWHVPLTPTGLDVPSDPLLQTAMDCIEYLPHGQQLLTEPVFMRQGIEAKLWAKDIIVKHYTGLNETLLLQKYTELHTAILNLILADQKEHAISALQLYMILLPVTSREELYRLLKFMRSLAADTTLRLDQEESNEMAVLGLLTDSIFKHKLLAANIAKKFVQFMMNHIDRVFTIPRDVRKKVAVKLYQLKTGKQMLGCESSFCNRVSKEEFERQSKDCTEESLIDLMNSVLDDTHISLKEKKNRLKQFQKSYPDLYEQNFDGML